MHKNEQPIIICGSKNPTASVIWLHGLGADGHDFVPVIEMLALPAIRFILPHAPYRKITLNNGYEMRGWYDLYGLDADSPQDETGINATRQLIDALVEQEIAAGINSERIVLAGFSQGGALALHTALRYRSPLAGVLALSTYLPLKAKLAAEKSTANQSTPIWMAHGSYDEVIQLTTAERSLAALKSEHYAVTWREYAMAHSVCAEEINDIRQFLTAILPGING